MECSRDCACYGICPWLQTDPGAPRTSKRRQPKYGANGSKADGTSGGYSADGTTHHAMDSGEGDTTPQDTDALQDGQVPVTPDEDDDNKDNDSDNDNPDLVRTYRRRWLMLGLFSIFSMSNAYMWIHLNIIANIVLRYYNASLPADTLQQETAVDWLSLVYMLAYLLLIPIGMYILDSFGLRVNNVTGCALNAVGAWLKCFAVSPNRFPLLMVAQTLCGMAQVFIVSLPPRLAAVWFGPNEVSTATAIGVFGNQLGVAIGFLVPPRIVNNSDNLGEVTQDLGVMFYSGAGVCTLILLLMLLFFQTQPPHPPSRAQLLMIRSRRHESYSASLFRLLKSVNFLLMMISYGLNTGCYYAISTLLNYMVLFHFPGEEVNVGSIGLTIILTGIAGSIVAGVWLDRSKFFKSTSVATFVMCVMGMLAFTFTLDQDHIWVVFITAGALGFFMTGYLPVGYEFATEITYPEPEGTSSGLLTASAMFFGIVMTLGMRAMMNQVSILAANIFVSCVLVMGTIMTALVKARYHRQEAEKKMLETLDHIEVDIKEPITK
ncbi:choline/ethanolamine transporter flvcr2b-like [Babylonia areolata]|uniref:choline/ethanolamine transporter flvcr2b-like n=1 Tax=Babylonia areolata TaxID=304850 RepID=UPI003FD0AC6A